MDISLYRASVPVFIRGLSNLSRLLEKASASSAEQAGSPADLIDARLAPDMLTLAGQVQRASDAAKGGAARLAGIDVPSFADDEQTLEALQARIAKTIAFLESVDADAVNGDTPSEIVLNVRGKSWRFTPEDYLLTFALPNFFFHVATAHGILRHTGAAIGKSDYLGAFDS